MQADVIRVMQGERLSSQGFIIRYYSSIGDAHLTSSQVQDGLQAGHPLMDEAMTLSVSVMNRRLAGIQD